MHFMVHRGGHIHTKSEYQYNKRGSTRYTEKTTSTRQIEDTEKSGTPKLKIEYE
jgi:hypothetical protein